MSLLTPLLKKSAAYAPVFAATPVRFMPEALQNKPLEWLINKVFYELVEDDAFDFLQGRWLKLSVTDMQLSWRIGYDGQRLLVDSAAGDSHVSFSGNANDLLLMASRKVDPDTLFFNRRLSIEGNTELGLAIKNLIDSIDMSELPRPAHWLIDKAGAMAQRVEQLQA